MNIIWNKSVPTKALNYLSGIKLAPKVGEDQAMIDSSGKVIEDEKETVGLGDCFEECKKPELLDEDNKWYCR